MFIARVLVYKKNTDFKLLRKRGLNIADLETLDRLCERGEMLTLPALLPESCLSTLLSMGYVEKRGRSRGCIRVFPTRAGKLIKARRDALKRLS